jgi:hypothetical protein
MTDRPPGGPFEDLPSPVVALDVDGIITRANLAARAVLGPDLVGRWMRDLLLPESPGEAPGWSSRAIDGHAVLPRGGEWRFMAHDGVVVHVKGVVRTTVDEDGSEVIIVNFIPIADVEGLDVAVLAETLQRLQDQFVSLTDWISGQLIMAYQSQQLLSLHSRQIRGLIDAVDHAGTVLSTASERLRNVEVSDTSEMT